MYLGLRDCPWKPSPLSVFAEGMIALASCLLGGEGQRLKGGFSALDLTPSPEKLECLGLAPLPNPQAFFQAEGDKEWSYRTMKLPRGLPHTSVSQN